MLRLTELSTVNFGALGTRSVRFDGRSAVVYGANEAGKTTLSDALLCALFGKPAGTTTEGKAHLARYGASYECRAVCDAGGRTIESLSGRPCGAEYLDEALFRELLCSQRGVLRFRLGDPELNAALSAAALGGSRVSVERAQTELAKVFDTRGSCAWMKRLGRAQEAASAAEGKLAAALNLRGETDALRESRAKESALESEVAELEAAGIRLREARRAAEAAGLQSLKARRRTLAEKERLHSCAGLPGLESLAELERTAQSLRNREAALERERSLQAQAARDAESEADAEEKRLAGLADAARLDALDAALRAREAAALAAAGKAGGVPAWVAPLAGAAAAVVFGAPAWKFGGPIAGLIAASAAGVLAWFFVARRARGEAAPDAGSILWTETTALDAALRGAGWAAMTPEEAGRRCALEREDRARTAAARDNARARALASRGKARDAEAELETTRRDRLAAEDGMAVTLRAWKANDRAAAERRLAEWEGVRTELKSWEAEARGRLPDAEDLLEALDRRLLELEGSRAPAGTEDIGPAELEKRDADLSRALADKRGRLEALRREVSAKGQRLALQEASLGGTAEELLNASLKAGRAAQRIVAWRDAAREAHRILAELSASTAARMEALFEAASPLFRDLTAGRYTGVRRAAGPGEPLLKAVHATAGERPLEWLSSGTNDVLWLSVRLALARQAMPGGGIVILDEPLHALDPLRAGKALRVLFQSEELRGFQVLLLTKDDRLADLAADAGALKVAL